MADKLFEQHETARKSAGAATAKYERSIRGGGKAKEPDDARNKGAQSGRVKREVLKGK